MADDSTREMNMDSKERVLAILQRQKVDRIPIDLWHTPEIGLALRTHFNVENDLDLYRAMGLDKIVRINTIYTANAEGRDHWGIERKSINTGAAIYEEITEPVLKGYDSIESLNDFPYWPDPDKFDYETAISLARQVQQEFATLGPWVSFFEIYCAMRGMEQAMMDLAMEPKYVNAALDKIEHCQTQMMQQLFNQAGEAIDMVFISDDMGSQKNLIISLDMWDKFFKERMIRWCKLVHSYGKTVFYHTDGAAEQLIPRLIETGIDILNPIQHACPGMETAPLKEKYGDKIIFHGGIDNQSILPFGTAEDVKKETLQCLDILGKNKEGYICCSCHNVQAATPIENVLAMVETVKACG